MKWVFRLDKLWFEMRKLKEEEEPISLCEKYLAKSSAVIISSRKILSRRALNEALKRAAQEKIGAENIETLNLTGKEVDFVYPEPENPQ